MPGCVLFDPPRDLGGVLVCDGSDDDADEPIATNRWIADRVRAIDTRL
jgi:hypothetical protein